jgi:hypothetical protein
VIKRTHKAKIDEIIAQKTDESAGNPGWLRHHPAAVSQVIEELTEGELEEAEEKRRAWAEEELPEEIQRK